MAFENWYCFWAGLFWAVRDFLDLTATGLQNFWNRLPKEAKVSLYMFGAVVLDNWAKSIHPEVLTMIPPAYRILAFNLIEVFLVETAKRIRAAAQGE